MITNPILPGFNPDPSILRIGDDYWIATSTFEWLPGIQLHHSRDLKHWRLAGHALTRPGQLELRGVAPSKGVWAPCLSRDEATGTLYLCFSVVRAITDNFFDLDNLLITAPSIDGPWSDPVYLNSSGFDPSLFHDADGRKWLVNLEWDFRQGYEHPGAIVLQEYDVEAAVLVGEPRRIYRGGSELGCLEGAHLYRRDGLYYLMAAEGGTGYGHGVTMARSPSLTGPWEADPANPILSSTAARFSERGQPNYLKPEKFNPESYLQKSGHGSIVETPAGEVYLAHLCARPAGGKLRCVLGRETAIQRMLWTAEGWLRLADESGTRSAATNLAQRFTPESSLPPGPWPVEPVRDDFDTPKLSAHWASPRVLPDPSWLDLATRPGWLGLRGRESLFSAFDQSLVARRVQGLDFRAQTCLDFQPTTFQQMAGLVCVYDTMNFIYLRLYHSESLGGPSLGILRSDNGKRHEHRDSRVKLPPTLAGHPVHLRVTARDLALQFAWSLDGLAWTDIGPAFDETTLSDEYCTTGEFTGAFVGLCAQDLARRSAWAWFDWFAYEEAARG